MDNFILEECKKEIKILNKFKEYIESKEYLNRLDIEDLIDEDLEKWEKLEKVTKNRLEG